MKFKLKAGSCYDGDLQFFVGGKWVNVFGCYGISAEMSNAKSKEGDLLGIVFFSKKVQPTIGGKKVKEFVLYNGEKICFQ